MDISITVAHPDEHPQSGPVAVGWFLMKDEQAVLFDPPERVTSREPAPKHAKSAARCPAVVQLESRYFAVKCPYDLHLGFGRDEKGKPHLINRLGDMSPVRRARLNQLISLVNEEEWRHPARPTVQLALPYCFIADELVYLSQISPFLHYRPEPWPGTIFGGRFPISVWPRPLMWAFEWHDVSKDLVLRRGEPLFYVQFEASDPARAVQVVEAERTAELDTYLTQLGAVVNYVNQTFGLFKAAQNLRPARLLTPKRPR